MNNQKLDSFQTILFLILNLVTVISTKPTCSQIQILGVFVSFVAGTPIIYKPSIHDTERQPNVECPIYSSYLGPGIILYVR